MSKYSQPDFYHFSQDSIWLANFVSTRHREINHLLDVCAGSGVVGIEVMRKQQFDEGRRITFIELQEDFKSHLTKNSQRFLPSMSTEAYFGTFSDYSDETRYDCIVSNPPYFLKDHGKKSDNPKTQICRTFEVDSMRELFLFMLKKRANDGHIYFLGRNNQKSLNELYEEFNAIEQERRYSVSIYKLT